MSVTTLVKSEFARDVNDNHVQDGSRKSHEASDEKCRRVQLVVPEPKRFSPSQPVTMTESRVSIPTKNNPSTSPTLSPGLSGIPHLPWQLPLYHCFPHYPLLQYPGFSSYPFPILPEHVHPNAFVADYMKYLPHMGMFPPNQFPPLSPYHVSIKQPEAQESESIISKLAKEEMKDNRETRSPLIRAPTVFLEKAPVTDEKKKERDQDHVKYQCDTCSKTYSTFSGLSKHKQFHCTHDSKKEFTCKYCEKTYFSLGALKMHIRTHTLPCKCKICGKAFSRPWLLQGHVRTHTGEKPFTCVHCLRAFADRSNLRAHLQTHSDVKKYSCQSCSKTFSRMSLLLKHEDTCRRTKL